MRILALCGSLQARSGNLTLLETAARRAPAGVTITVFDGVRHLPPFDPDIEAHGEHAAVAAFRRELSSSDAVLIASPEYGHSLSGSLKNAIDWVIGTAELEQKIVAITCAVPHPERGRMGLAALRGTLGAVSATIAFDEPIVKGPGFEAAIDAAVLTLVAAIEERRRAS